MGIESPLMTDSQGKPFDKFYELPNGCICCTAKGDLLNAIEYLIQDEKYKLDYILIETNGLADPSETIKNFWVDDNLESPAQLKSIHTVLSAYRFKQLKKDNIFIKQLIYADTILINQIDKSNKDDIDYIQKDHEHGSDKIKSIFFELDYEFDFKSLENKIGQLVWEQENIFIHRIKGIIKILNDNFIYELQGVKDIFEIKKSNVLWKNGQNSKFLFICENLTKDQIIQKYKSILYKQNIKFEIIQQYYVMDLKVVHMI
ncbi:hypothetical protein IMG5_002700 [Ichthyophthirius multifiliis]|uniref:CobW/HypB/UreG nucleotide-binding domain-containing protein n=1 Tax=Ichthyophthirius multifiliis TaxID=5932 RepID=G0QJ56_ICHMU|nr:hypothetical protein IMG5_002700 [Ichthyophthirius multifiliis]EGR34737.1 hypothetical protein IMG5_002700 [Ichthyophthirius multifiliis]|eukprot:XP_004040041.1 hypothetical protein IMG5_002700 [Ichthyophthirius multifiliis]